MGKKTSGSTKNVLLTQHRAYRRLLPGSQHLAVTFTGRPTSLPSTRLSLGTHRRPYSRHLEGRQ